MSGPGRTALAGQSARWRSRPRYLARPALHSWPSGMISLDRPPASSRDTSFQS
nr:hypothetical protein [Actinomadura logoneensis]